MCDAFALICFTIIHFSSSDLIHSVTLTPQKLTQNGATINIASAEEVSTTPNTSTLWNITCTTEDTWHLIVNLDNSWGFHPRQNSTISLEIDSPTIPSISDTFDDIIVAFTAPNSNQWIGTRIYMDNDASHESRITPSCHQENIKEVYNYPKQITGNLSTILNNGSHPPPKYDQRRCILGLRHSCDTNNQLSQMTNDDDQNNSWPVKFILENHPQNLNPYVLVKYQNKITQTCGVKHGFITDKGLQIYFAIAKSGQAASISSFALNYTYEITHSPTINPTMSPTFQPSYFPTFPPSNMPSKTPTTYQPTKSPSFQPSYSPTFFPSNMPSKTPTTYPSKAPTLFKLIVSSTHRPTNKPTVTMTDIQTSELNQLISTYDFETTQQVKKMNRHFRNHAVIFIFIPIFCVCFFVIIFLYYRKYENNIKYGKGLFNGNNKYIPLLDMNTNRHNRENNIVTPTFGVDTTTKGEGDDDDHEYTPPILRNEGSMENNRIAKCSDAHSDIDIATPEQTNDGNVDITGMHVNRKNIEVNDLILSEQNTAGKFEQILNDNVFGVDMVMDDIIQEMDTDKN